MQDLIVSTIKSAQNGDKDDMAKLVEENQGLIWSIVKRFTGRGYEIDDLYQIGCMGFIKSIRNFDSNYEVKLSTYAVPYILGEIKRFLRDDGPVKVSRSIKDLNRKILELQKEFVAKKGREATIIEIAKILKTTKEEIILALESVTPVNSIEESAYSNSKDDNSINILETLSNNKDEASIIINKIAIDKIINKLNPRDKEIILLRYFRDKTQMDVAKIMGISQVQVSRIEKKILQEMKKELA